MRADQATTLRSWVQRAGQTAGDSPASRPRRVLAFTSGKGGVGKTQLVVNLGYALCEAGARVLLFDADLGLANVDVLLGLTPRFTLQHVLRGEKRLADILLKGPQGLWILPASSGVQELAMLSPQQHAWLLAELRRLAAGVDFLLVDTGAGIAPHVTAFTAAAHDVVVVVTPEPTSLTDAYALIKVLATKYGVQRFWVLPNAVADAAEARDTFRRLSTATERFLRLQLAYFGFVPRDRVFGQAVRQQRAVLELYPHGAAARCLRRLARDVVLALPAPPQETTLDFWQQAFARQGETTAEDRQAQRD
ncbi:MAG: site-determining protein [Candidatus Tectimicrobiota bacterium]|nr:MAG: site-determining protein [Candidatus Tectomicrobia bacterium]